MVANWGPVGHAVFAPLLLFIPHGVIRTTFQSDIFLEWQGPELHTPPSPTSLLTNLVKMELFNATFGDLQPKVLVQ